MPPHRSWLLATAAAIVGLVAGLGFASLLRSSPNDAARTTTPPPSVGAAPETAAASSRPTPAAAGPAGARSPEGAVAAAVTWIQLFTPRLYIDDTAREAAIARIATEDAAERLQRITDDVAAELRANGVTASRLDRAVLRTIPVGYEVVAFDGEAATVAVWVAQITHVPDVQPLTVTWSTQTTAMRWEREAWRLVSVDTAPGPLPDVTGHGDGFLPDGLRAIEAFTEFTHAP